MQYAHEYDKASKQISNVLKKFENPREHPFISSGTLAELRGVFERVNNELSENENKLLSKSNNDEILQKLVEITDGKVGTGFSPEKLEAIYVEGENRVKSNIPPGFVDAERKKSCGDNYRIYGDLILWKEIIEKSKIEQKGVIFVSDDKKEDWWLDFKGRRIGPLPYLFQEFIYETSQTFYMYTVDRFIEYASLFQEKDVAPEVIQETKDVREAELSWTYKVIAESELLKILTEYEDLILPKYVGLKVFVTSILAEKGYEINHSYAIINNLRERGLITMYEIETSFGVVKAISSSVQGKEN